MPMLQNLRKHKDNLHIPKEYLEYTQGQINKIRNSVEDR